jgi:DNA polymerase-4
VVSTACYVARIKGVKSAMPMFKALALCPEAIVIRPDIRKYSAVGKDVRELMLELTPQVEPISIDEAFLDLTGTTRLHGRSPALSLATLLKTIETKIGISASAGLSYNKYLAKVASDLEKPRGYSIIGKAEAKSFLAEKSVSLIWGVGRLPGATAQGRHKPHWATAEHGAQRAHAALRRNGGKALSPVARRGRPPCLAP